MLGTCWVGESAISSLSVLMTNYKNFKKELKYKIYDSFGYNVDNLWWVAYNSAIYFFKKKNYKMAYQKIKKIYPPPFKIKIRVFIIKIIYFLNCLGKRKIF